MPSNGIGHVSCNSRAAKIEYDCWMPVRLTNLENVKDDINRTDEEKDEIRRLYVAPFAGLAAFDLARDGSH